MAHLSQSSVGDYDIDGEVVQELMDQFGLFVRRRSHDNTLTVMGDGDTIRRATQWLRDYEDEQEEEEDEDFEDDDNNEGGDDDDVDGELDDDEEDLEDDEDEENGEDLDDEEDDEDDLETGGDDTDGQ